MKFRNVDIEWLGHATFLIRGEGKVIYFDPFVLPENPEKADLILITHDHFDHCSPDKVERIKKEDTSIITTQRAANKLNGNLRVIKEGDELTEKGVRVKAVPAYNIGKSFHPRGTGVGFIIELSGTRIYHAGDTDFIPEMSSIKTDIALLPIGGTYTMNEEEAARAALTIKPKLVIPMHYNYIDGTSADPNNFKQIIQTNNPEIRVEILK